MNWALIGLLALNVGFALTTNVLAKMWALHQQPRALAVALSTGLLAIVTFILIIRAGGLAVGSSVALLLTLIGNVLFGFLYFKEVLSTGQWAGIILGFVAVLLILNILKF